MNHRLTIRILATCLVFIAAGSPQPAPEPAGWVRHVIVENFHTFTVAAADFTGDGRIDVIANGGPGDRDVLFVAPEWQPVILHEGIKGTYSMLMDVNGDGRPDFVCARYTPGRIYWLEQPKSPVQDRWAYHVLDETLDGVHGLAAVDLDGDGHLDLIANSGLPKGSFADSIAWFAGPSLERHILASGDASGLTHYIEVGDVNGDGRLDVATSAKTGNWFGWWEAPSDRTHPWKKHVISENQEGASNLLFSDINGDGRPDFIASRGHGKGLIWFEAPNWKPHEFGSDLEGPHSLAIGDLNGDGRPDVVTCAKDAKTLVWFENDGRGDFTQHVIHRDQAAYQVLLIDMDGDGDLDILVAGQESRNVVWYENRLSATRQKR